MNDSTEIEASRPAIVASGAGSYFAAWESGAAGDRNIFARRFGTSDVAAAAAFPVNAYRSGNQTRPAVAASPAGSVVVWQSDAHDGSMGGIVARTFDSGGDPLGFEFLVNDVTAGHQGIPVVAMAPDGRFVIAWADGASPGSWHVSARLFDATGLPVGASFAASPTGGSRTSPAVGMAADGGFVVAWTGDEREAPPGSVSVRRFSPGGRPLGDVIDVGASTSAAARDPAVDVGAAGDFVVAWQTLSDDGAGLVDANGDGSGYGIAARRYSADGVAIADVFRVNAYAAGDQMAPAVSSADDGSVAITWNGAGDGSNGQDTFARLYDASGAAASGDIRANNVTDGEQLGSVVALDNDGRFVVAWQSTGAGGAGEGVYAQRFERATPLSVTGAFVSGKAWTPAFRARVAAAGLASEEDGFRLSSGTLPINTLPWADLNQLAVRFNRDPSAHQFEMTLGGVAVAAYPSSRIEYDPARFVMTWTFARVFPADRLTLRLNSAGSAEFVTRFNVLPGDANRDGAVNAADALAVRSRGNLIQGDLNGSGLVDAADYALVRGRQGSALPATAPAVLSGRPVASLRSEPSRRRLFSAIPILM